MAKVKTHVEHMRSELSDRLSPTISKIWVEINKMCPEVRENTFWVGKVKWAFVWIATVFVGGGLVSIVFYIVKNGVLKIGQ